MKKLFVLALSLVAAGCGSPGEQTSKRRVIFDTDWGPDVDDVGALAVLHALADGGEVDILGVAISFSGDQGPTSLDAVNTFYGRPDIPIASIDNVRRDSVPYRVAIAQEFAHDIDATQVEEPVSLYRRVLATQLDRSVTIISVGFLTNLAALLESPGDEHSPLSGPELVRQKVALYVQMGGRFPEQIPGDYNLNLDIESSHAVLSSWPTPILFSGGEIGAEIMTGTERLRDATTENNPIRRAYEIFNDFEGRFSWDQTAVWAGVRGAAPLWDVIDEGSFEYDPDGSYRWLTTPDKDQSYLIPRAPISTVEDAIEQLMAKPPGAALPPGLGL
ncbi:MAG: nucleoside hydrolase [Polyangiales bacterium]|jgi:inosine-uridine nucleoside N-ribohydrolase